MRWLDAAKRILREAWEDIVDGISRDVTDVWENIRELFEEEEE